MTDRYNIYSKYLKEHYGEKVYKLPIKLDLTCPNRDGRLGHGGCIYCHEEGGSFENKENTFLFVSNWKKTNKPSKTNTMPTNLYRIFKIILTHICRWNCFESTSTKR